MESNLKDSNNKGKIMFKKIKSKLKAKIRKKFQRFRIVFFRDILSDCRLPSRAKIASPTLFLQNDGEIIIDDSVNLGVYPSPLFYSGHNYMETRNDDPALLKSLDCETEGGGGENPKEKSKNYDWQKYFY